MSSSHAEPWFTYSLENQKRPDSAVVMGAGIAGCQTAWHLARSGIHVTLLERHHKIATEGSGNVAAVICPKLTATPSLGDSFYQQCFRYSLEQFQQLNLSQPIWNQCGVLQLMHQVRDQQRWQKLAKRGLSETLMRCVTAKQASDIAHTNIHHRALWFPEAGWIKPEQYCQALLNHSNIEVHTDTEALSFKKSQQQWLVTSKEQQFQADILVIASGKNLGFAKIAFLEYIGVHGQTSIADAQKNTSVLRCVIDHEGYITPPDGNHQQLFGSSYDRDTWDLTFSEEKNQENLAKQQRHLPEIAQSLGNLRSSHSAVRITSPDRLPYVGAVPDTVFYEENYRDLHHGKHWKQYPSAQYLNGLYINTAYASRGLTTAALCARHLNSIICGIPSPFDSPLANALHPARFLIKGFRKPH
ncbi:MAG: tRNA 5-methylaminomethyl-2-thiouridine biosynthesis bifunctional protein MnmC [uncultured Thiotrichaceae bacterium]|uniref:tRNA 5-methylaminomethyl-2-thiouridine biosynthesis bifunctional protein MnmC n=1 Tax=uncultured Thiotrichaceae bacterium TaxID=298394 RepID=A0A6S6TFK7_9GAMM|nr:MAG: tRNA 5-methylaminomethyl-2-thiouridine biosynthesis bifunctional protein MnmC [uncultured Thiotrichaceae bacterium]